GLRREARLDVAHDLPDGQRVAGRGVVQRLGEHHTGELAVDTDQRTPGVAGLDVGVEGVHLALDAGLAVDVLAGGLQHGADPPRPHDDAAALLAAPARLRVTDDLHDAALGPPHHGVAEGAGIGARHGQDLLRRHPGEDPGEVAAGHGPAEVLGEDVEALGHE